MINKKCQFCFRLFKVHNYRNNSAHFCSSNCYHNYQMKLAYPEKTCPQCGNQFKINRKTRYNKYCGIECSLLGRRKYEYNDKVCPQCDKVFSFNSKNPYQIFCSQKCNAKSRAYKINENFFHKINSESSAYFLGLMFSDGNVSTKGHYMHIGSIDKSLIESCKNFLETDRPIYTYKKCYSIIIGNEVLHKDLLNWGVVPRKSWKELSLPSIPKKWMQHFIRGVYDGDGSFFLDKRDQGKYIYLCSSLTCSSLNFLKEIKILLEDQLNIKFHKIRFDDKGNGTGSYQLKISRKNDVKKFTNYLYRSTNYYLERKHNFVQNFYAQ